MKCLLCKNGDTAPGFATITLEHAGTVIVFRNVPAEICNVCGEAYTDTETTDSLLAKVREAASAGVEVQVRQFAA